MILAVFVSLLIQGTVCLTAQTLTTSVVDSATINTYPYEYTGFVTSKDAGGSNWRGSGSVVRHRKIVLTAAHCLYDVSRGAYRPVENHRWFWKWQKSHWPPAEEGIAMRGVMYWSSYSAQEKIDHGPYNSNTKRGGLDIDKSSPHTFDVDFAVMWAYENTAGGGYGGYYPNGRAALESSNWKMITGYPSAPFGTTTHAMHRTGHFLKAFSTVVKSDGDNTTRYMRLEGQSTVRLAGNSGGPVWVYSTESSNWYQAGIYVSGDVGVVALDANAWSLAQSAMDAVDSAPNDDHSSSTAHATGITRGTWHPGVLEMARDIDVFRFTAPTAGYYVIESAGNTDVVGELLRSDGFVLQEDDDSGDKRNFRIMRHLTEGTYYIRVTGWANAATGGYHVRVTYDDHPNETHLSNPIPVGTWISATLAPEGDVDVFKLNVNAPGVYTIESWGNTDVAGELLTGPSSLLAQDDDSGYNYNFRISRYLTPGIYYIRVRGASPATIGNYQLRVSYDDHSNTLANATDLPLGPWKPGELEQAGDIDMFTFTAPVAGYYIIESLGGTDLVGALLSSTGSWLEQDDDSGSELNFLMIRHLDPGTYYVRVSGAYQNTTGKYHLSVNYDDHSGTLTNATPLELGTPKPGVLETSGDVDMFVFQVPVKGRHIIESTSNIHVFGALLSASGSVIAEDRNSGQNGNFRIERTLAAGTYYVRVSGGFYAGAYHVSVFTDDHADSPAEATALNLGAWRSGRLERPRDIDAFRFTVPVTGTYLIESTGPSMVGGKLLSSSYSLIEQFDDPADEQNFRLTIPLAAGDYIILVSSRDGAWESPRPYKVRVTTHSGNNNFASWARDLGLSGDPDADFDEDGLSDGLEYALAELDPKRADGSPGEFDPKTGLLTFSKRPEAVLSGEVSYVIESSDDLGIRQSWTPVAPRIDDDYEISAALPRSGKRNFMRLRVEIHANSP